MAGTLTITMKNIAFCIILLCILRKTVSTSASNTNMCPDKLNTCQCLYGNNEAIDVDSTTENPRVVGLAAATGALGGILATGTAFAAYFHFRGSGGGGGSPGGGFPSNSGDWRAPRSPRPDSMASSSDSFDSQAPLTKADRRGEKFIGESRARPYTGASTTSSVTNIYRHAKVWPGRL